MPEVTPEGAPFLGRTCCMLNKFVDWHLSLANVLAVDPLNNLFFVLFPPSPSWLCRFWPSSRPCLTAGSNICLESAYVTVFKELFPKEKRATYVTC